MTVRRSARCRCRARLAVNGDSAQTAPVRLRAWLEIAVFAVLCLALRASRYRADLGRWRPPPAAAIAPGALHAGNYPHARASAPLGRPARVW
jgi:hypothetical protein